MKRSRGAYLVHCNMASRKIELVQGISVIVHRHTRNSSFPDSSSNHRSWPKGVRVVWFGLKIHKRDF